MSAPILEPKAKVPQRPEVLAGVERALVIGFARTGQAVARVLKGLSVPVVVVEDHPSPEAREAARRLGVELAIAPGPLELARHLADADLVVASPGVPPSHPALAAAPAARLCSEIELAAQLSAVPLVAITGTNGKTTVTGLVAEMLRRSGTRALAAGNIGRPLVEAVLEDQVDLVVAEVSSFQLAFTRRFRPVVATWLNFAEDHLDWHDSLASYAAAKARIFAAQRGEDVAVANAEDEVVLAAARASRAALVTFGLGHGDYTCHEGTLVAKGLGEIVAIRELPRALPHDLANALAACATAISVGASPEACRAALVEAAPLPHRVAKVGSLDGVDYYDDSKATTPSAVAAALAGFRDVVLIAGGRNKGLDLSALRAGAEPGGHHLVRAVVAIGEAAPEVAAAFTPGYEVVRASSMGEAVELARKLAHGAEAVLLSPGCASFDWYRSYEERGQDFAAHVRRLALEGGG